MKGIICYNADTKLKMGVIPGRGIYQCFLPYLVKSMRRAYFIISIFLIIFASFGCSACRRVAENAGNSSETRGTDKIQSIRPEDLNERIENCEEAGNYVPGFYDMKNTEYPLLESVGGCTLVTGNQGIWAFYGFGYNENSKKAEHRVAVLSEGVITEIHLQEIPEDYRPDGILISEKRLSVKARSVNDLGSAQEGGVPEDKLFIYDLSGRLLLEKGASACFPELKEKAGSMYLVSDDDTYVWLISPSLGILAGVSEKEPDVSYIRLADKETNGLVWNTNGSFSISLNNEGMSVTQSDDPGKEASSKMNISLPGVTGIYPGTAHDLLLLTEKSLYGVSFRESVCEELLTFTTYGIDYSNIAGVLEKENGEVQIVLAAFPAEKTMIRTLTPVKTEDRETEDNTITIACLQSTDLLRIAVYMYNEKNPSVRAKIKEYYDRFQPDASLTDSMTRLNSDIMSGIAGDIVCLNGMEEFINRRVYHDAGVFMNLYDLMDADTSFDRSAYFTQVFCANEIGGELMNLTPLFSLRTMMADAEANIKIHSIEEMVTDYPEELVPVFGSAYTKTDYLKDLCLYVLNEPEDPSSTVWNLEKLAAYIKAASYFPDTDESEGEKEYSDLFTGKQYLFNTYSGNKILGRFYNFIRVASAFFDDADLNKLNLKGDEEYAELFSTTGHKVSICGFPEPKGNGSAFINLLSLCIPAHTQKAADAWTFLKFTLEEEYQTGNRIYTENTIPVNRNVFSSSEGFLEKDPYFDSLYYVSLGHGVEGTEEGVLCPIPFIRPWMKEALLNTIEETDRTDETDPGLLAVLSEETQRYTDGALSPEKAAENVQNRLRLYYEE